MRSAKLSCLVAITLLALGAYSSILYAQSSPVPTVTSVSTNGQTGETVLWFDVTVASSGAPVSGGYVEATYQGSSGLTEPACSATITNGYGTCTWNTNSISPGQYLVTADYSGTDGYAPSSGETYFYGGW